MHNDEITRILGQRFHGTGSRTVIARPGPQSSAVVVTHVVSDVPMPEKTSAPPREAAFSVHVHHRPLLHGETWIGGKHANLPPIVTGGICIFDLETSPVAVIREPLEFSRFYLSRAALDDLTYDSGLPRISTLRVPELGRPDGVIHGLALALLARAKMFGDESDSLFADWVALAFHAHVVRSYGQAPPPKLSRCAIAPWRLRSVCGWMSERLDTPLTIAELAAQVDMTPSYFARAFRDATGEPPHKWLMRKRVERAKDLLRSSPRPLAEIATTCGFVDQSHLTRVFGRSEGVTPRQWRTRLA